jgi:transcription initiation factor TFIIA small subunit
VKRFSSEILLCSKQGHLHTYRFCDNVWTFILENASFKTDNEVTAVDRVKIVACDAKILAH